MSTNEITPTFFDDVRSILAQARQRAYTAINFAMVEAYWQIGKRIVEEEQDGQSRADYGSFLIKELSKQLTAEFGKGFAVSNLWNFRQFYMAFPDGKLYALRRELTWTHYPLAWDIGRELGKTYTLKDEKIWLQDNQRLAPYGMNSAWVSNTFHHYCLQFRNE